MKYGSLVMSKRVLVLIASPRTLEVLAREKAEGGGP